MADKPSYKLARDARKGEASMEIEGAVDLTKPKTYTDKSLPAPGKSDDKISPNPKAGEGWRKLVSPEPAHPEDTTNTHQDTVKT